MSNSSILWGGRSKIGITLASLASTSAEPPVGRECTVIPLGPPAAWPGASLAVVTGVIICPTSNNAGPGAGLIGGYAFMCTTAGNTGTSQPAAWNQTVGGTTADNTGGGTAVWTNIGYLQGCVDVGLGFEIAIAGSGALAPGASINFYFGKSLDGTNFTDNLTGADAGITLRAPSNLIQAPAFGTIFTPTGGLTYKYYMQWSEMFGSLPPPWLDVVVVNQTGQTFSATEAIHTYSPAYGLIV